MIIANKDKVGPSAGVDWSVIIMDQNPAISSLFINSDAYNVTNLGISRWNTAYSRGDRR
jgi:hypothetical protein